MMDESNKGSATSEMQTNRETVVASNRRKFVKLNHTRREDSVDVFV